MIPFALYALKVVLCSAVLTGYYYLALRNRLFHHWNRFYLLISVLLSVTLPLCSFTYFYSTGEPADAIRILQAVAATDNFVVPTSVEQASFSWKDATAWGYIIICAYLFLSLLFSFVKLFTVIKKHKVQQLQQILFLNTSLKGTPFSFFNYLFWNHTLDIHSPAGQQIFRHELTHIRERHTWDKLFMQLVFVPLWFNPFFWLMRHELRMIHEFIADKKSVNQQDATELATLILQTTYPAYYTQLTNSFFQHSIKRRLIMLTKLQNPGMNYKSRILTLPLIILVVTAFTLKPVKKEITGGAGTNVLQAVQPSMDTIPAKKIRTEDISEMNVVSDKRIELKLKDGTVHVYTLAELKKQGLINDDYSLGIDKKASQISISGSVNLRDTDSANRPLVVINGDVYPFDALNAVDPQNIQSIDILKDASAKALWGERGKNGVIQVTLKNGILPPNKKGPFQKFSNIKVNLESDSVTVSSKGDMTIHSPSIQTKHKQIFTQVEVPPQFPGGPTAWSTFLSNTLRGDVGKKNKAPNGSYTVIIQFIVDTDGTLTDFSPLTELGYGLEEETIRTMKLSPRWIPAVQNRRNVKSYHKQPITFIVTDDAKATTLRQQ